MRYSDRQHGQVVLTNAWEALKQFYTRHRDLIDASVAAGLDSYLLYKDPINGDTWASFLINLMDAFDAAQDYLKQALNRLTTAYSDALLILAANDDGSHGTRYYV